MSEPVVFLDVDGVLNTRRAAGWSRAGQYLRPVRIAAARAPRRALDCEALERLSELCTLTGARVVVTSQWRRTRDVPAILAKAGFSGTFHRAWKTDADGPTRGDEIRRWLSAHGWAPHVVIDDWREGLEPFRDCLVLTDHWCGLTAADVDRAIALLNSAPVSA